MKLSSQTRSLPSFPGGAPGLLEVIVALSVGLASFLYGSAARESTRGPEETKPAGSALYQGGEEGVVQAWSPALQRLCGAR